MNPAELIKGVDHAAAMDDRWLFLASLVVFGVFAALVMRYFVGQHERLIEDHKQARDGGGSIDNPYYVLRISYHVFC